MIEKHRRYILSGWMAAILVTAVVSPAFADARTLTPSAYWKNEIAFPYAAFCARGISKDAPKWVKFTILLAPYDPNVV